MSGNVINKCSNEALKKLHTQTEGNFHPSDGTMNESDTDDDLDDGSKKENFHTVPSTLGASRETRSNPHYTQKN